MRQPASTAPPPVSHTPAAGAPVTAALAWFIPGGGHFVQGQYRKAAIFFVVLTLMFVLGLAFGGRLFPFQMSEPLVFLAAVAQWAVILPRAAAAIGGFGQGSVTAVTYEYGNTFLIVSGLLNALVILDARDLALGRRSR